jgi:hypothetical protein
VSIRFLSATGFLEEPTLKDKCIDKNCGETVKKYWTAVVM